MESVYSVTRQSIAYMVAAHARTHTHTHKHTPQSMITHQGFRVESWALIYRRHICRSLGLVVERPQCASLFAGPRLLQTSLSLIRVKQNPAINNSRLIFNGAAKALVGNSLKNHK